LDAAVPLTPPGDYEVDDVLPVSADRWWFSAGTGVFAWEKGEVRPVADVGRPAGALATSGPGGIVVAVEGRGLVGVDDSGAARDVCADEAVRRCVTDVAARPDGGLVVTVGSTEVGGDGWARELTKGRATGRLVVVDGGRASVAADGLAWPAGVAVEDDGSLLVSVGQAHRIERRAAGALNRGSPVLDRLAFYPGRIRRGAAGWWVAVPYLRNRATELVLSEPAMAEDMINSVDEEQWLVPSLRRENIYLDPLQMGQLRVLGVLKPWAPPRSYGLVFLFDSGGRVVESHHSRADGKRHGMTGVGEAGGRVVVAGKGCRSLLELRRD
ncbi:MAG: SMP-30/gluconolactonase/LRE family protein, partial [Actinobacteria bacterium]|nr:SMP-30/gluconolactonase/LRE family protein [Actinomycetota bacterium]